MRYLGNRYRHRLQGSCLASSGCLASQGCTLAGKPKGIKRILKGRGLWPGRGLEECLTTHNRPGRDSEGGCYARGREGIPGPGRTATRGGRSTGLLCFFLFEFHCGLNLLSVTSVKQNGVQL